MHGVNQQVAVTRQVRNVSAAKQYLGENKLMFNNEIVIPSGTNKISTGGGVGYQLNSHNTHQI